MHRLVTPELSVIENFPPTTSYEVVAGDQEATAFDPSRLNLNITEKVESPLPGVTYRGTYTEQDSQGNQIDLPVVSFLYHKVGKSGELETTERLLIWRGVGYGVLLPGHRGQVTAWYLAGAQIGTFDPALSEAIDVPTEPSDIGVKGFSIACITGGPLGEPVVA